MIKIINFMKGTISGLVKGLVGFLCCWNPVTAPLLTGWLNRFMLRSAVRVWTKRSTLENACDLYKMPELADFQNWPRWSKLTENTASQPANHKSLPRRSLTKIRTLLKTLWSQYKSGLFTLFNTWLLTLPFAICWLITWWAGLNNYFTRSYEEYALAPLLGFFSITGFAIVMLYVPIAQARQAVHGTSASFFDIQAIHSISKHVRIWLLFLAFLYAAGFAGIMAGTKLMPAFFEQVYDIDLNNAEAVKDAMGKHFLFVILSFYAGLLIMKHMNARIYAIGVLKALAANDLKPEKLSPFERELLLERLTFKTPKKRKLRSRWLSIPIWSLKKTSLAFIVLLTICLWSGASFSIYFGQFVNHSNSDWLNMPLIQMPYIRIPKVDLN